jgi:low affinity Fe/Cu permease
MKMNFYDRFTNGATCFALNAEAFAGGIIPVIILKIEDPVLRSYKKRQLGLNTTVSRIIFTILFLCWKPKATDAEVLRISFSGAVENRQGDERKIPATIRKIWEELHKKRIVPESDVNK